MPALFRPWHSYKLANHDRDALGFLNIVILGGPEKTILDTISVPTNLDHTPGYGFFSTAH
jgi:hypothetical protein